MKHHNARVITLQDEPAIAAEIRRTNAEDAGIRHMLPKAKHYLVKLENVRRPISHILKETFLAQGGDASVSRNMITATENYSDVLLMGTRKQYQRALKSLLEQGFGCDKLAAEIEAAIRHFDSTPSVPSTSPAPLDHIFQLIGKRTLIMGILNITPDSFSDGGQYHSVEAAATCAMEMVECGADIIDVGGESTRPGSEPVDEQEELNRVIPVIQRIREMSGVVISIDTYRANVAEAALDAGASIVNDISGASFDPRMPELIGERQCPVILMHIKGTPKNMQQNPEYTDLMGEITGHLRERIEAVVGAGADEKAIFIDPGFGFGKTYDHNMELLQRLRELKSIGRPIVMGTSRKSSIGKALGGLPVDQRMEGTAASVALSIANGADVVRVHDVKEMTRVAKMTDAVVRR